MLLFSIIFLGIGILFELISIWSLSEYRLFNIGGHFFTGYVMSPVIYLAISVVLVIAGAVSYNRFQVTGSSGNTVPLWNGYFLWIHYSGG